MPNILQVPVPVQNAAIAWPARQSNIASLLFINQDLNNSVWIGQEQAITAAGPNTIPIPPNGTFSGDASSPWYVIGSAAGTQPLVVVPNGQSYFLGLTQGLGQLAIPSVRSPGYVPGVTGWTINKNGSVEFNSGTFRGTVTAGVFEGNDFIINPFGVFLYNGAPGPGNLIAWWAFAAGTDQFGNRYTGGLVLGPFGGSQVMLSASDPVHGGFGSASWPTGAADEGTPLAVYAQPVAAASPYLEGIIAGPVNGLDPDAVGFKVVLASASDDSAGGGVPSGQACLIVADTFGVPYLIASNTGDASQAPSLGIGGAVPGTFPAGALSAPVTCALNGVLGTYGTTGGGVTVKTFTSSGTWTAPAGVTSAKVEVWGGGAGGQWASGPGGGGGEYAAENADTVVPGNVYTVTVGAGGAGGTSASGTGKAGGSSSFSGTGATTVTAHGAPANNSATSAGGTGSANSVHFNGGGGVSSGTGPGFGGGGGGGSAGATGAGGTGAANSGSGPGGGGTAGPGGGAGGGGGGWGGSSPTAGSAGGVPGGGGGSGGASSSGGANGGAGARGQVRITYTVPASTTLSASLASAAGTDLTGNAYPAGYMGAVNAVQPGSAPAVVEGWHAATLASGWVNRSGYAPFRVKKLAESDLAYVQGNLSTNNTVTSGATIGTMPAGYWNTSVTQVLAAGNWTGSATVNDDLHIEIGNSGSVLVFGITSSSGGIGLSFSGLVNLSG